MFRRSTVILAASLALLSTLDSATCFAAAAPAQQRDDLERPRFLKKEIKRFVFANTTTPAGVSSVEASTSDLEALQDALTSSATQDLGIETTPTSITPTTTATPSVTPSDNAQSSSSDASQSSASDADRDREAALALQASQTTTPVSSAPLSFPSTSDGEGVATQSSSVPGANLDQATGSIQSSPSSSASRLDQVSGEGVAPQATSSSTVEQPGNGVTSSQIGSTAQPETSASPSSAALLVSSQTSQQVFDTAKQTSSSPASGTPVSSAEGQGPSTSDSQVSPSTVQQTDTQVQADNTQRTDALQSSLSSEGDGKLPATTSIAGSSSVAIAAGQSITTNSNDEAKSLTGTVPSATGGVESPSVTTAGAASSAFVSPTGTTINSEANEGAITATTGNPLAPTSAGGSLAAVPGETVQSKPSDTGDHSLSDGEATSGIPASNTKTDNEGPVNSNTNVNSVVPTTLGSGEGSATTHTAQPASSPFAPQSVAVPATGTSLGHETSPVSAGSGDTQSTSNPGGVAGLTSQSGGVPEPSASTALQPNPAQSNSGDTQPTSTPGRVVGLTSQTGGLLEPSASTALQPNPVQTNSGDTQPTSTPGGVAGLTSQVGGHLGPSASTALQPNPVQTNSGDTQPSSTPGGVAGLTSQVGGHLEPSASTAFQPNPVQTNSQAGGSLPQTTLSDGAVVPNTAQITGTAKGTAVSSEAPLASLASQAGNQVSSPNSNAGATKAATIFNPSLAALASKLNTIPASVENPLASISGSPSMVFNPSLPAAASSLDALSISVHNPEHHNSLAGPSPSASVVVPGGSSSPGGSSQNTAGATGSPLSTGSPIGATGVDGTTSPAGATGSPMTTGSPVGVTGTSAGASESPPGVTGSLGATGSPISGIDSSVATGSPVSGSGSPVATGSPTSATGLQSGGTESPKASGQVTPGQTSDATGLQTEATESPKASGQVTPGQLSGGSLSTAQASGLPGSGPTTASNGEIISGTPAPTHQSATPESGIAAYSTQSNGKVVPISAAVGTASSVSNGQIVPLATGQGPSAQSLGPNETGAASASNAVQSASAAAVAAGATQNSAPPPGPNTTPVVLQPQQYSGKGPYTQAPIGHDTSTTMGPPPTSILHGPSSTPSATQGGSFGPSSLPSNVPQILYQNGGPGTQPPNTALINIAFRYELNYLFVYNHTVSQEQIFHYIPRGICWGLEINAQQITMQSLRAWDTYEDVGYVTTLALAWIPEGLVDSLSLLVSTSVSRFYNNPDNSTNFLLSMINSAIPIVSSNDTDGVSPPFGTIPSDSGSAKNAGAPIGGDIGNSEHVRASSVGIGVGVACGAAAYGAAMFFVARRYKKRRQSHVRSPSMFSSPVMSHAGPDAGAGAALMSGAMGERSASPYYDNDGRAGSRGSGRSGSSRHQISAPVMAENSLGWN